MKIVCSGHLVRHPVGGLCWHHLQYLVGFARMGHSVTFFEDHGWYNSCYDPTKNDMTEDPTYGLAFVSDLLRPFGLEHDWCFLKSDGSGVNMSRDELAQRIRECDVYFNLSNVNWISELQTCRRRALIDTDPVFTQIGGFGMEQPFDRYHTLFTYGENVHRPGCDMPTLGQRWLPTRQPVVTDLWPATSDMPNGKWTSVLNWNSYGAREFQGKVYGQKDREFEPCFDLPRIAEQPMELAVRPPPAVEQRLWAGGWEIADPLIVTRTPRNYQDYIAGSRGEFSVAKHGYVSTRCGWFSDRSAGYLASGKPVVVQDTGFTDFLPSGEGLLAWRTPQEAAAAMRRINEDYPAHCRAAKALVSEHFDYRKVLGRLLEQSL